MRTPRRTSLFWLPLRLVWSAVTVVALPTLAVVLAWWWLPERGAQVVTGVAVLYVGGVALVAGAQLRGRLRSMSRGAYTIRRDTTGRRRTR